MHPLLRRRRRRMQASIFVFVFLAALIFGLGFGIDDARSMQVGSIVVNTTADVVADDGACSLREAITSANTDIASGAASGECAAGSGADTIALPAGVYTLAIAGSGENANATGDLDITADLIINGAGADSVVDAGGIDRALQVIGNIAVTLNDLTVQNGNPGSADGGGILAPAISLTNVQVLSNTAAGRGAGVYVLSGASVTGSLFRGNTTTNSGGGLYHFSGGQVYITNTQFISNTSSEGGGVMLDGTATGPSSIENVQFIDNVAVGGGGLSSYASVITVTNSLFQNNRTTGSAGGMYAAGDLVLLNSRFISNTAAGGGGGVSHVNIFSARRGEITNSLFAGNQAGAGSAIASNGNITITHVTIGAQAQIPSYSISFDGWSNGSMIVRNTVIANQATGMFRDGPGQLVEDYNLFSGVTSNFLGAVTSGGNSVVGNAGFVDPVSGDYHLSSSSAAIDAGANVGVTTDFEGDSRPQGGGFDIGFDESPFAAPTPTPSPTPISVPPTDTPTATPTPVVPTDTPTATPTATATPVTPTDTPTATPTTVLPTDTPTSTPIVPTNTATATPIVPTSTPTTTPTQGPGQAIIVSTLADVVANDGQCTLREAVAAANTNTASGAAAGECAAGNGADIIQFAPALTAGGDATLALSLFDTGLDANEFGATALYISSAVTIQAPTGNNGITIQRAITDTNRFRLFQVLPAGSLTLRNLTLRNGLIAGGKGWGDWDGGAGGGGAAGMGGAIFNDGALIVENSMLANNEALGGVGGFGGAGGGGNGGGGVGQDGVSGEDTLPNPGQGGGPNGGLGNIASPTDGGNGGGGGGSGIFTADGGDGGFGGGGGGATGVDKFGGNGGFGGGGGGNRSASGTTGLGGFGGGNSDRSAAGGGAGMGGAIFNRGAVTITNSTLSGNEAEGGYAYGGVATTGHSLGGAIFNLDGAVTIRFSTLSDNRVPLAPFGASPRSDGGAIFNKQLTGAAVVRLDGVILANSTISQTDLFNDGGSIAGSKSNIVETNAAGANGAAVALLIAANGDPGLGALADNGGPTFTQGLLAGSPAINAVASGVGGCATAFTTDQRGLVRPQGSACDVGAAELFVAPPPTATPTATVTSTPVPPTATPTATPVATAPPGSNRMANGSFENQQLVTGGSQATTYQGTPATIGSASPWVINGGISVLFNGLNYPGANGKQILVLAGNAGGNIVSQAVTVTAGVEHMLSYSLGSFGDNGTGPYLSAQIFLASNLTTPIAQTSPQQGPWNNFTTVTLKFTPAQSNLVVRFVESGPDSRRRDPMIDNVVLTTASSSTPTATPTMTPSPTPTNTPTPVAGCPIQVTSAADGGAGSLRQAIITAGPACNRIVFAQNVGGQTIRLASMLEINKSVVIDGSGRNVIVSGDTNNDGTPDVPVFAILGGNVTLRSLTIEKGNGTFGLGGGISVDPGAHLTLDQSIVRTSVSHDGDLVGQGAGIYSVGVLTVTNSVIRDNQALGEVFSLGGGIYAAGSSTTIMSSTITGNSAYLSGGGIQVDGGSFLLIGSAVYNNRALESSIVQGSGGGVSVMSSMGATKVASIINSTISGNSAVLQGGGLFVDAGSQATLVHTTFSNNRGSEGGNLFNSGKLSMANSIVANASAGGDCVSTGTFTGLGGSLVEDGSCIFASGLPAQGDRSGDPLLGPLQDNGGSTWTHALLGGSPALNTALAGACPATDQRGQNRDVSCDMGAFEAAFGDIVVTGVTPSTDQPCLNQSVDVAVLLGNATGFAVGPFTLQLYDDAAPAGNATLVQSVQVGSLAANSSQTVNLSYTAAISGTRYLKAVADLANQVVEANDNNNRAQALVAVDGATGPNGTLAIQKVNNGQYVTGSTLSLALTVQSPSACRTQPTQMRFYTGGQYTAWEPVAASKSLTVAGADGDTVSVFAQLRDAGGAASELFGDSATLDLLAPDSKVTAPAGVAMTQTLTVAWSGVDAVSGITRFDVQRQVNDGGWQDFQIDTLDTSAVMTGAQYGSAYCFRSKATDAAGNAEAYPAAADTCVTVQQPGPTVDLFGTQLELTQAIQNANNSMPLITNRPLLVRLTLGIGAGSTTISNTNAVLHVLRNGQELPGSPLAAENGPITARTNPNRNIAKDLLHFRLPAEWLNGNLQLYAEIDPQNRVQEGNESNNRFPVTGFQLASFKPENRLEVMAIPIRITDPNGKVYELTTDQIFKTLEPLRQTYPIAGLNIRLHAPMNYSIAQNGLLDADWNAMIKQVRGLRTSEKPAAHVLYFGMLPSGLDSPYAGQGGMPGKVSIGTALLETTAWHEIGHNSGRKHIYCERAVGETDLNYPYPPGGLISNTGWNYVTNQLLPSDYRDFMSYCYPRWVSDYTYLALYNWLVQNPVPVVRSLAVATDGLLVSGQISEDGLSGSIDSASLLPRTAADGSEGGAYRISLVQITGEESFTFPFDPGEYSHAMDGETRSFAYVLLAQPNLKAVRLYRNNILLDEMAAGSAPTVDITSAPPVSAAAAYTLTWTGTPGATYLVRFSPDNGTTWQTVVANTTQTSARVETSYLQGTTQGILEVRASANLQTAADQIGPFTLSKKAPAVHIDAPQASGELFTQGQTVTLIGNGYDFEDGVLAPNRFTWSSNRDGVLGTGSTLAVSDLTPGVHIITLSATDSDNQTSTAQVEVQVLGSDTSAATRAIAQPGVYEFGTTGAVIEVLNTGGCLENISVRRTESRHPNANDQIVENRFWTISQTGCSGANGETFLANVTLPVETTPNADRLLCRYSSKGWDCAASSYDVAAGTVTRSGVREFSDWTIGRTYFHTMLPVISR